MCVTLAVLLAFVVAQSHTFAAPVPGANVTYTLDADFDKGTLLNVNHDSPNNDQLQLSNPPEPFPFVNIAASARGTIVRINAVTGEIVGEFLTAPDGMGRDPSRTTVDQVGNVWVANRAEGSESGGEPKGSIARIGLIFGGTRSDADGTPNLDGQYLKPPFQYSTCRDRDGDGRIRTSRGLGSILAWPNTGGADTHGGVSTAEDECIINYVRVTGTATRTVAVDYNNDVWVGGLGDLDHEKVDGVSGLPVPGTQFNLGCGGYGGLLDGSGVLWSSRGGGALLRYDTNTQTGTCLDGTHGDYGLGIDPQTGEIWHTFVYYHRVAKLAPDGTVLAVYPHGGFYAQGVAVDGSGNVWVANSLYDSTVGHLRTDGTFVGNIAVGSGPTGVAVDANGKVWVANLHSSDAMRIDPNAGPIGGGGFPVGAVDLTVSLGDGAGPYNYSDMTGFVAIGSTSPQGTWTVTQDAGTAGATWTAISWNGEPQGVEPPQTAITVRARAADDEAGLSGQAFVPVLNGEPFSLTGRFIEVQVTLKAAGPQVTPVLSDIRIGTPCGDGVLTTGESCDLGVGNCPPDASPPTCAACTRSCTSGCRLIGRCTGSSAGCCTTAADCPPGEGCCGNGLTDPPAELCDDGNLVGGDTCTPACQPDTGLPLQCCPRGAEVAAATVLAKKKVKLTRLALPVGDDMLKSVGETILLTPGQNVHPCTEGASYCLEGATGILWGTDDDDGLLGPDPISVGDPQVTGAQMKVPCLDTPSPRQVRATYKDRGRPPVGSDPDGVKQVDLRNVASQPNRYKYKMLLRDVNLAAADKQAVLRQTLVVGDTCIVSNLACTEKSPRVTECIPAP